jgi:hypothetical protein
MRAQLRLIARQSVALYALFLFPTVMWLLYAGSTDAALSRHIGATWQAGFWHVPALTNAVSRYLLDGLEWLAVGLLTWLFWLACCKMKSADEQTARQVTMRWAFVCGLVLLAVIPFHSSDLYGYLNRGFQQSIFHTNPYLTPIAEISGWQNEPLLHAHWEYNPCPYGFFFARWADWLTKLSGGHFVSALFLMKLANLFFLLGTVFLIAKLAKAGKQERPWFSAFLFGANPLVLLHVMGNGHNDILMVFLLLLALACLRATRWNWLTLPILALSVLVKYASGLAVPFVLLYAFRHRLWKVLLLGGVFTIMLGVLMALPYVEPSQPWPWAALLENAGKPQHSIADMLARMVYYPAKWLKVGDAKAVMQSALGVIKPLLWAGFALFYVVQVLRVSRENRPTFASLLAVIALVMTVMVAFVSAKFHPWYVVMFLPLVLLLPQNAWVRHFGVWFSLFQIAGFTLLQNVHVLNVLLLTLFPLWLSFRQAPFAQTIAAQAED